MRVGITVFLTDGSGLSAPELGRAVEERGFSSLFLPEHTHLPVRGPEPPGPVEGVNLSDYPRGLDPLITLAGVAAVTSRIRLGTGVLLVAQHDPILLAKQVATLDFAAGGRVILGIGFGWNEAEAADHGLDFGRRRAVAREHVLCMRALWEDEVAQYHGELVDLPPSLSWPKPVQRPGPPVLIGGAATPSVFRAVCEYGDGWLPIGGAGLTEALPRLRAEAESAGRDPASISVVPFGTLPSGGKLGHYEALGITEVVLRVRNGRRDEILGQLDDHARWLPTMA